ncbi:MAG: hypothetical protein KC620_08540, partial [Myxococcales bacterium]|nr:hypothetical protein [Myxococcales bacterium]
AHMGWLRGLGVLQDGVIVFYNGGFQRIEVAPLIVGAAQATIWAASGGWSVANAPGAVGMLAGRDGWGPNHTALVLIDGQGSQLTGDRTFDDTTAERLALTWAPGRWGTLRATTRRDVRFRGVAADGQSQGSDVAIGRHSCQINNNHCTTAYSIAIEWLGDRFVAAWKDDVGTHLRFGRFDCESPPDD